MKNIILSLSMILLVVLMISTYIYQNQATVSLRTNQAQETQPDEMQQSESDILQPVTDENISYSLQEDVLNLTYNDGAEWIEVPIEKEALFAGEYQENQEELIEGSFILTEDHAAFLYSEARSEERRVG